MEPAPATGLVERGGPFLKSYSRWVVAAASMAAAGLTAAVVLLADGSSGTSAASVAVLGAATGLVALGFDRERMIRQQLAVAAGGHGVALDPTHARDGLTGLPTRETLTSRLNELLEPHPAERAASALLFIDVDGLATVNATLGHEIGDAVIATIAGRLARCLEPDQVAARLGGDELGALVENGGVAAATALAERALASAREPMLVGGHDLSMSVSIGIAPVHDDARRIDEVLRLADRALVAAKRRGRGRYEIVFSAEDDAAGPLERRVGLHRAVRNGELRLHYQPVVAVADGTTSGVEALLRWQHPVEGLLAPGAFLAGAVDDGLMLEIGNWVLDRACRDLAEWPADAGAAPAWVSVNVAPAQLRRAFVHEVSEALRAAGLRGDRLVLEVTEDALVRDAVTGRDVLQRVRDLGCQVAIDDFGTGYSSLGYLLELPVDVLKVDRIFTEHLTDHTTGRELVAAIVGIGRALGARVVIEGVETAEQLSSVRLLGCELVQGYYFARPAPIQRLYVEPAPVTT